MKNLRLYKYYRAPPAPAPHGGKGRAHPLCVAFAKGYLIGPKPYGKTDFAQGGELTVLPSSVDEISNGLRSGTWLGGVGTGGYEIRADGTFHLSSIMN